MNGSNFFKTKFEINIVGFYLLLTDECLLMSCHLYIQTGLLASSSLSMSPISLVMKSDVMKSDLSLIVREYTHVASLSLLLIEDRRQVLQEAAVTG